MTRTSAWGLENRLTCQWFWQANLRFLSTDVTVGVTRGVKVTRHIPIEQVYGTKSRKFTVENIGPFLKFEFQIRVRLSHLSHMPFELTFLYS